MSEKVQVEVKLFNPGVPTANGRIYNEEAFVKAVEEYLSRDDKHLVFFDDNDCGPLHHRLEDVCGEIEHIDRNENNEFTANIALLPSTYGGKMVCELLNNENIDTSHMCITPDGFYDPEEEKLTITTYSVSFENDNKRKDNKETE